jgi:hypothetical protein
LSFHPSKRGGEVSGVAGGDAIENQAIVGVSQSLRSGGGASGSCV